MTEFIEIIFGHLVHMTFCMLHMTILYIYGFITLRACDIIASHMTKLTEILILMFGTYGAYDKFIKHKGGIWGI